MSSSISKTKRALNVAFILCILWSAFAAFVSLVAIAIDAQIQWDNWFFTAVLPSISGYAVLAAVSYVFFGRVNFWHKSSE